MDRKQLRYKLLNERQNYQANNQLARQDSCASINHKLIALLDNLKPKLIGLYWPILGEYDCTKSVNTWARNHACQMALPYAQEKNTALRFFLWKLGDPLELDIYGIPAPTIKNKSTTEVYPDLLLIPCLGFVRAKDGNHYRLGYGSGCYDRTLRKSKVLSIGLADESARLSLTVFQPQAHDAALTYMLTNEAAEHF